MDENRNLIVAQIPFQKKWIFQCEIDPCTGFLQQARWASAGRILQNSSDKIPTWIIQRWVNPLKKYLETGYPLEVGHFNFFDYLMQDTWSLQKKKQSTQIDQKQLEEQALSHPSFKGKYGEAINKKTDSQNSRRVISSQKRDEFWKKPQPLSEFQKNIYLQLLKIPFGQQTTYRELAKAAHTQKAARAVGSVMRKNPWPLFIPCHRVLRSDGSLGWYTAPEGAELKAQLLKLEGIKI